MPLSKTNLAEKYAEKYGESGNTLQKLRRNLKDNGLTFKELLNEVNYKIYLKLCSRLICCLLA